MAGVLALRADGTMSMCTANEEDRGKGRCNHVAHKNNNETIDEFMSRTSNQAKVDKDYSTLEQVDSQKFAEKLIKDNQLSFNKNPNWEEVILNLPNARFSIGSEKDGTLEYAEPIGVKQETVVDEYGAEVEQLTMQWEFRGEVYEADFGQVPKVQDDGTIQIGQSDYRVLPVMAKNKSGYVQFENSIGVLRQDSTASFPKYAMFIDPNNPDKVKIGNTTVDTDKVQKYLNGEDVKLTDAQKWNLDNIDPVAFERYPEFKDNIRGLAAEHHPDEPNDVEWKKFYTYKDQVAYDMDFQLRRMGNTFRKGLVDREKARAAGDSKKLEELEKRPLFYQQNNTNNIKQDLLGRSNVQLADNLNALSALSQSRKVSLAGKGGFDKDRPPESLRMIHPSHKDVFDQLDTASGKNIGLTATIHNADIDDRGFLVKKDKGIAVSDFAPFKYHNDANRAQMAVSHMRQATPVLGGEDPRVLGDSSDKAWQSISGQKMGVNLRVAYTPHKGTFEDATVISESAARKMATKQTQKYNFKPEDVKGDIKVGSHVKAGQYVNGQEIHHDGVIKKAEGNRFYVESTYFMGVGDKIAGRHGNKGVVSKVLPDSEMPQIQQPDGSWKPAEILMSPMGVPGRMNPSQIFETNGGTGRDKFNEKKRAKLPSGNVVDTTAGTQFVMRLNHIADKKLAGYAASKDATRSSKGLRMGEMESLILSSNPERLKVLKYLRNQDNADANNKFEHLMKAIGADVKKID